MTRKFFGKRCIAALSAVLLTAPQAWSIGFVNPDDMYDPVNLVNGTPYIPVPDDLLYPTSAVVARVTGSLGATGTRGTATMLDGNWFITHNHYWTVQQLETGDKVYIGDVQYLVGTVVDFTGTAGSMLFSITDTLGNPVTISGVEPMKVLQYPLRGMRLTTGSYGITTQFDQEGTFLGYSAPITLRWAKNTITDLYEYAGDGTYDLGTLDSATSGVNDPLYTKYQWAIGALYGQPPHSIGSSHAFGSSGSSVWARNGWEGWGFSSDMTGASAPSLSAIQTYVSTYGYQTSQPVPTATKTWDPYANQDVSVAGNWAESTVPTDTDTVWIDDTFAAKVYSGTTLLAQDMFVGAANTSSFTATLSLEGGDVAISDSLYIGAETDIDGALSIASQPGTLSAQRVYVGYRGIGSATNLLGTMDIDNLLVVGKASGSTGTFLLGLAGEVNADSLVVGAEPGSTGTFTLATGGTIDAPLATIGHYGEGHMVQSGGDASFRDLAIGYIDDSTGTYSLSGGTLTTELTEVSTSGGSFTQTGGTHTVNGELVVSGGTYEYSGGVLETEQISVEAGGTMTQTGTVSHDTTQLSVGAGSEYELHGGSLETETVSIQGTLDFGTGTGALTITQIGVIDMSGITLAGGANATLNIPNNSLVLVSSGTDLESQIGNYNNSGSLDPHVVGTTLTIPSGAGFGGQGDVDDLVSIPSNGYITAGTGLAINLNGGLVAGSTASVDLGEGVLVVEGSSSILDDAEITAQSVGIKERTGHLIASGVINVDTLFFSDGLAAIYPEGPTLEIGPGTSSLTINYDFIFPVVDSILMFGLDGTQAGEFDQLILTENTPGTSAIGGSFVLDVAAVGSYVPAVGDSFEIITLTNSQAFLVQEVLGLDDITGISLGVSYEADAIVIEVHYKGDLDDDGFVGLSDLDIILDVNNWNQNVLPGDLSVGDLTGDGIVGLDDLDIVLNNWNSQDPPPGYVVPEPTMLALLSLGGMALLRRRTA